MSLSVSSLYSTSVTLVSLNVVVSVGATRVVDGIGDGAVSARSAAMVESWGVKFTPLTVVSVPVLTAQRSTPQLPLSTSFSSSSSNGSGARPQPSRSAETTKLARGATERILLP